MRRDSIDFFIVPDNQIAMHERLVNWSRWVSVRNGGTPQSPIWRLGKSNTRQWEAPEIRDQVNQLDGLAIERAVALLPVPHREALRWHYVWRTSPPRIRRQLGVTNEGLMRLVKDARSMLTNRRV